MLEKEIFPNKNLDNILKSIYELNKGEDDICKAHQTIVHMYESMDKMSKNPDPIVKLRGTIVNSSLKEI